MKAERLYESQGGPIILSQVSYKNLCTDKIDGFSFLSECTWFFLKFVLDMKWLCKVTKHLSFSSFGIDWEWIWTYGIWTWCTRKSILKMGRTNGFGTWYRCPMGHVQARWCPRSYCKHYLIFFFLFSMFTLNLSRVLFVSVL